jgi:hypothetical protein
MEINGKTYWYVPEESMCSCHGCCANVAGFELCGKLTNLVDCGHQQVIWKEYKEEPVKTVKDEVREWVAAGMPSGNEETTQIAGTKYDAGKVQYTLVPPYALQEVARNLTEGLKKYKERNNWQKVEGAEQRYMDALMRHFEAIRRGEIYDVDSTDPTTSHMSAVAVNAMFLLEFMYNPNLKNASI